MFGLKVTEEERAHLAPSLSEGGVIRGADGFGPGVGGGGFRGASRTPSSGLKVTEEERARLAPSLSEGELIRGADSFGSGVAGKARESG